jgi:hypothetical protein
MQKTGGHFHFDSELGFTKNQIQKIEICIADYDLYSEAGYYGINKM